MNKMTVQFIELNENLEEIIIEEKQYSSRNYSRMIVTIEKRLAVIASRKLGSFSWVNDGSNHLENILGKYAQNEIGDVVYVKCVL